MQKYVYLFSEGNATMRNLLGGKGANLAEMTSLGMPVPQGFTITTEACTRYYEDGKTIGADIQKQIDEALAKIEAINEKKFGDGLVGLNYHKWVVCKDAVIKGQTEHIRVYQFLREPLIRRFGESWYAELCEVADQLLD